MKKYLYYTWDELTEDVRNLAHEIRVEFNPTKVVGLVRGGEIPGVMMSHMFNRPHTPLKWSKRDFHERDFGLWLDLVKQACDGTKILIVEDIVDSGDTLREMKELAFRYFKPVLWENNLKFASLFYNVDQNITVDFYVRKIHRCTDDRWIMFPYEIQPL